MLNRMISLVRGDDDVEWSITLMRKEEFYQKIKRICRGGHNDDHHDDDKGVADIDVNDVNADADISMMSMMMMMTEQHCVKWPQVSLCSKGGRCPPAGTKSKYKK